MPSIHLTPAERQRLLDYYRRSADTDVRLRAHILLLLDAGHLARWLPVRTEPVVVRGGGRGAAGGLRGTGRAGDGPAVAACGRAGVATATAHHPAHPDREKKLVALRTLLMGLPADETAVFMDEVDANLNPNVGCVWMRRGQQATVGTPGTNEKRYTAGSIHWRTGTTGSSTSRATTPGRTRPRGRSWSGRT